MSDERPKLPPYGAGLPPPQPRRQRRSRSGPAGCLLGAGIAGLVLLVLAVVAIGGILLLVSSARDADPEPGARPEPGPSASASASPTPTTPPWCELLTPDEAEAAVGEPVATEGAADPDPDVDTGLLRGAATGCALRIGADERPGWIARDAEAGDLGWEAAVGAARSAGMLDGDATGLGDEAVCVRRAATGATGALVRSGETVLLVMVQPLADAAPVQASCGQAGALARAVLGAPVPRPSPTPEPSAVA